MLIKEWMSKTVITVKDDDSLSDTIKLFQQKIISMVPVLKNRELVGIVTDGDVKKAAPSDATSLDKFEIMSLMDTVPMHSIMSKPVVDIKADHTVDEAARIMLSKGISGMPVLDKKGAIEGIITKSDIFRCLVSYSGSANKEQIFSFKLPDKADAIKILTDMIRQTGGRLCSILASYDEVEQGFRKVFIHAFDIDSDKFDSLVEKFQNSYELLYAADLSRKIRKIY